LFFSVVAETFLLVNSFFGKFCGGWILVARPFGAGDFGFFSAVAESVSLFNGFWEFLRRGDFSCPPLRGGEKICKNSARHEAGEGGRGVSPQISAKLAIKSKIFFQ
jgi:hypothetical protein